MSRNLYRIYLNEILREEARTQQSIVAALDGLNARRVRSRTSHRVLTADWNRAPQPDDNIESHPPLATFDLPREMFEMDVPKELTEPDGVSNERILISIDYNRMDMALTDASIPSDRCGEIVADIVAQVYQKATGKRVDRSQIAIKPYARLAKSLCEHCLESVDGQPYRCRVCGRCFCYLHRSPETHGCVIDQKVENGTVTAPTKTATQPAVSKPKLILRRIPCG